VEKNNLVTDGVSGEVFCGKCGFVIDEKISDNGSERMFSDSTVNKSRTGDRTSLTRHDHHTSKINSTVCLILSSYFDMCETENCAFYDYSHCYDNNNLCVFSIRN